MTPGRSRSTTPPPSDPRLSKSADPFDEAAATRERLPGGIAHEVGELHRLLVESVQDYAIFALDPAGYILSWNAGAQRFKGYTTDEIVGRHFSIFYPPDKVAAGWPAHELAEAARVGRFEDEGWRVRKDGSRFWANVVLTALHDEAGQLLGYAKVTRDLTDRRRADEALRLSEERFRLLVTSVRDYAIFMLDPEGRVATWNEGAERAKGYSAEEILGEHFSIFYPAERVAEQFPDFELAEARRVGRFEDEGWRIRKDGSRFWANVVITALRDGDGHLIGFGKVTRDLTERRAAEQRALEDTRRVSAEEAARHAADVARRRAEELQEITSLLAGVRSVANAAEVVFSRGLPAAGMDTAAIGLVNQDTGRLRIVADIGYEAFPEQFREFPLEAHLPMADAVRNSTPVVAGTRAERDAKYPELADSLQLYAVTVALPLMSGSGPMGALVVHRREQQGTEPLSPDTLAFLHSLAQQCGQAIERTQLYAAEQQARHEAEAAQGRAEEARARAEDANRVKGQFLAAMSHELRTPLNAIGGYTQLLELGIGGPITDEQLGHLSRIQRSQQHLLGIINDILNFTRIDAGRLTYHFGVVPLEEVMGAVCQLIEPQATAKDLTLRSAPCPPDAVVWGDRAKIEQIILNLLTNAVKFTDPGGQVTLTCTRPASDHMALSVQDTGSGIPPDQLERIFEPFTQVGRSLVTPHEGAGLGLAISRDLARAMGGDIAVSSTVGEGSTFRLTLPRDAESRPGA